MVPPHPWFVPDQYALLLISVLPVALALYSVALPGSQQAVQLWWTSVYKQGSAWGLLKTFYLLLLQLYWGVGGMFFMLDISGLLQRYRWQPGVQIDKSKLPKLFAKLATGTGWPLMIVIGLWACGVAHDVDSWIDQFMTSHLALLPFAFCAELPAFREVVLDSAVFFVVYEIMFYYIHVAMHKSSWLYEHFHKQHHEWTSPIALEAAYQHPVEQLLLAVAPSVVTAVLRQPHILSLCLYTTQGMVYTLLEHSGYALLLGADLRFHDLHHSKWSVNFGVLGCLDRLHGTYCEGEADDASAKPVLAKPVLHSTIVIEGEEHNHK